jgi:hypothetical protein
MGAVSTGVMDMKPSAGAERLAAKNLMMQAMSGMRFGQCRKVFQIWFNSWLNDEGCGHGLWRQS